jgi:glycosyltransferase involved in cell wall biosynthesis
MKIAMFLYNPFLHDSRVLREAKALSEAGHDVLVIATRRNAPAAEEWSGRLRVLRVEHRPRSNWVLWGVIERLRALQMRFPSTAPLSDPVITNVLRFESAVCWWKYCLGALQIAAREPADIYFAHDLEMLPPAVVARARSGGKVVYDSHELYVEMAKLQRRPLVRRRWAVIERALISRPDHIITISDETADELRRRYGIPLPSVLLNVPETPPDATRDLRAELGIQPETTLVLYLGKLQPKRGVEHAITAVAGSPDLALVLIGDGEPRYVASLHALVEGLDADARIRFPPMAPPDHVVATARAADVGLVVTEEAGLNHEFTLPNKLFQYLAAGVPVVTSRRPSLTALLADYDVGVTCDASDPRSIADAIHEIVADPERHDRLRANALSASKRFNWDQEAPKLLEIVGGLDHP